MGSNDNDSWRSRFIELDMGQLRDRSRNVGTVIDVGNRLGLRREVPFEALFLARYRSIRELARLEAPGVAIVAVHIPSGRLAGRVWLAQRNEAGGGGPSVAIVGRHSECDLVLDGAGLSLRHLALIVPPLTGEPLRFSLHDLRTSTGLRGALGQPMGGAHVVGAGFFAIGSYALFCAATGAPERWPELASEAWRLATGRTTALRIVRPDERRADDQSWHERPASVSVIRGPIRTDARLLAPTEARICTLAVSAGARRERLALGDAALDRGLLLGRYSRCDGDGIWQSDEVSRVHLLILRVDGEVFAFDTASTNGVYRDPVATDGVSVVNLSAGERAMLGDGVGSVRLVEAS